MTFFHVFFRGAAIAVYLFCGIFSDSFITSFVFVVLLLSADFWTVKNISGRILVGLRWWNYVDDEGVSHWMYESRKVDPNLPSPVNSQESKIFWTGLVLSPVLWMLFFIFALFSLNLKWMVLVVIAITLNMANLHGYVKCNFGANKDIGAATTDFVKSHMMKNAFDMLTKGSGGSAAQPNNTARPMNVV